MPKVVPYKPGEYDLPTLKLPPDLNLDLHAFCGAFYNASKSEVVRRALRRFIDEEITDPNARRKFEVAREELTRDSRKGRALRVVPEANP